MLNSLKERFESKYVISETGCWVWIGATIKVSTGLYGAMRDEVSRMVPAHRVSYRLYKGEIPTGFEVDHKCENKLCVNSDHLRVVPSYQNRPSRNKLICKHGHTNWSIKPNGQRQCKTCDRIQHSKAGVHSHSQ